MRASRFLRVPAHNPFAVVIFFHQVPLVYEGSPTPFASFNREEEVRIPGAVIISSGERISKQTSAGLSMALMARMTENFEVFVHFVLRRYRRIDQYEFPLRL